MGFTSNTVLVEIANRVATVLLNRPEKLNALDEEMMESLPTAIADVAADRGRWLRRHHGSGARLLRRR